MNKLGIEEEIIKVIDGEMYYKSHYCYWLYTQLEELQQRIDKAIDFINDVYVNEFHEMEYETSRELLDILRGNDENNSI